MDAGQLVIAVHRDSHIFALEQVETKVAKMRRSMGESAECEMCINLVDDRGGNMVKSAW